MASTAGRGMGAVQVLIVDDNEHMRQILHAMLRSLGCQNVREAREGGEALEALLGFPADLLIVDYRMSPMDGLTLARRVRAADSNCRNVPIMMLTGHSEASRVAEARDAGVNEFLAKPLSASLLVQRLNGLMSSERPFVQTETYYGPCRRRRADPYYKGPERRASEKAAG